MPGALPRQPSSSSCCSQQRLSQWRQLCQARQWQGAVGAGSDTGRVGRRGGHVLACTAHQRDAVSVLAGGVWRPNLPRAASGPVHHLRRQRVRCHRPRVSSFLVPDLQLLLRESGSVDLPADKCDDEFCIAEAYRNRQPFGNTISVVHARGWL